MFCAKCGAELKEGAKYCDSCGAKAEEEPGGALGREDLSRNKAMSQDEAMPPSGATLDGASGRGGVPEFSETRKTRRRRKFLIGASVAIAALAVGVLAFALVALGGADKLRADRQCQLGERYLEEMDYEAAIAAFKAAIEIEPREDAYIGLADAYVGLGDDASAIQALDEGIAKLGSVSLRDYRAKTQKEWEDKTRKIRGRVLAADDGTDARDSDGVGIPGIEVLLTGEDGETITCYTDEDGYFDSGVLPSGTYAVSFSKDGYLGQEREVEAAGGGEADVDVYLEPDTGVLVREVRYDGEMTEIYRSEYEYDQSGRVIRETENSIYGSESGHRLEYEYDGEGNLAKKYSFDGSDLTERTDYECDDDGRVLKELSYAYAPDDDGFARFAGQVEYEYAGSDLAKESHYLIRDGEPHLDYYTEYEHDEKGNVTKESFYGMENHAPVLGDWSEYAYDEEGRLTRHVSSKFYEGYSHLVTQVYEYDEEDNRARVSYDGSDQMAWGELEYDYDGNKIKETTYDRDGEVVDWRAYEYDEYGNVVKEDYYPVKLAGNHGLEEQHTEYQYKLVSEIAED